MYLRRCWRSISAPSLPISWGIGSGWWLFVCLILGAPNCPSAPTAIRAGDVARFVEAGELTQALTAARALRRLEPAEKQWLYDEICILTWLDRANEALALAPAVWLDAAPTRAMECLAKAAREGSDWDRAQVLYEAMLSRDPRHVEGRLGLAAVWLARHEPQRGFRVLAPLFAQAPNNPNVQLLAARLWEESGDRIQATGAYRRALDLSPDNPEARRGLALGLAAIGGPHQALETTPLQRADLAAAEYEALQLDAAATRIRWGELAPKKPAERYQETDTALAALDAIRGPLPESPNFDDAVVRRLVFDRMLALRNRVRMSEVLGLYDAARKAGVEVPNYALRAAGDAFLYLRLPSEAHACYQAVLARDPDDYNAKIGVFYAVVELDDFDAAFAIIDTLADAEPELGAAGDRENPRKAAADVLAAMARAYAGDSAHAQTRLEAMLAAAPANLGLRANLATIYRWRGWPRRARTEYGLVQSSPPEDLGAALGVAGTALDLRRWEDAERDTAALVALYPEHRHVQRLARAWELRNAYELYTEGWRARSDGPQIGTQDQWQNTYLFSRPFNYDYRAYLHHRYSRAEIAEGNPIDHRMGTGIEYAVEGLRVRGEWSAGLGDNEDPGAALQALLQPDDHWEFGLDLEANSAATPLRGTRVGVTGQLAAMSAQYRWHESQRAAIGYSYLDLSDDNRRQALSGLFERRVITRPRYTLTGALGIYHSHNSESDVAYFNPESDFAWDLTADNAWRVWRHYERSFEHRLKLTVGRYWQERFDTHGTWAVAYEHRWGLSDALRFSYGISRARRVFDGAPEFVDSVYGSLDAFF